MGKRSQPRMASMDQGAALQDAVSYASYTPSGYAQLGYSELMERAFSSAQSPGCGEPVDATGPAAEALAADDVATSLIRIAGDARLAEEVRRDLCRALTRAREQQRAAQERAQELERLNRALVQETNERRYAECIAQTQSRALSRSLELLVQEPSIDGFFAVLAKTLVEECDALACGVWLLDETQSRAELWMVRTRDQLYSKNSSAAQAEDQDCGACCISELVFPHDELAHHLVTYRPGWTQTIDYYGVDDRFSQAAREFHRAREVVHVTVAPLVLGTRNLGWITLSIPHSDDSDRPWRIALLEAMTRQATLALHQSRLAEQSRLEERRKAILEERNRLARDIHDTLAQGFAAILMQLQAAQRQSARLPAAVVKSLTTAIDLARSHILDARRSVNALRPRLLEGRDLASAFKQLTDTAARTSDVPIDLIVDNPPVLPPEVEDEIIRIAQEAIANATRHARARRITVRASGAQGVGFRLSVADDGRGFDPNRTTGFGMTSMQERAERIGASLTIVTAPRHGAEVVLAWTPAGNFGGFESTPALVADAMSTPARRPMSAAPLVAAAGSAMPAMSAMPATSAAGTGAAAAATDVAATVDATATTTAAVAAASPLGAISLTAAAMGAAAAAAPRRGDEFHAGR